MVREAIVAAVLAFAGAAPALSQEPSPGPREAQQLAAFVNWMDACVATRGNVERISAVISEKNYPPMSADEISVLGAFLSLPGILDALEPQAPTHQGWRADGGGAPAALLVSQIPTSVGPMTACSLTIRGPSKAQMLSPLRSGLPAGEYFESTSTLPSGESFTYAQWNISGGASGLIALGVSGETGAEDGDGPWSYIALASPALAGR